jgi:hypothetical protein
MSDDYASKMLQDRESRIIGAGVVLALFSPAFGIIAGAFLGSASALYIVTAIVAIIGVLGIAGGTGEKIERKKRK